MRIPSRVLPKIHLVVVAAFAVACAAFFAVLWVNMGGQIPGVTGGYEVSATFPAVQNLVDGSDVMIAGVKVGSVRKVTADGHVAHVVMELHSPAVPLHQGATVRISDKTLVQETYVEVQDGNGPPIPDHGSLPPSAVKPAVTLDDVLASLDPQTRAALGQLVRSLGPSTAGTKQDVSALLSGLGALGRQGHDALDAIAAQSQDLQSLSRETATLLAALDEGQGQVATLVDDARQITGVTAATKNDVANVVRQLPSVLDTARTATGSLRELSGALGPVAQNLKSAAPYLNTALQQLPGLTADLHGLLPSLNGVLASAPATLQRVPAADTAIDRIIPITRVTLSDVNPMLGYLEPYGRDLAAFFSNLAAQFASADAYGHFYRAFVVLVEQSVAESPVNTNQGLLDKSNAYPAPGQAAHPGPFTGTYPRIHRESP